MKKKLNNNDDDEKRATEYRNKWNKYFSFCFLFTQQIKLIPKTSPASTKNSHEISSRFFPKQRKKKLLRIYQFRVKPVFLIFKHWSFFFFPFASLFFQLASKIACVSFCCCFWMWTNERGDKRKRRSQKYKTLSVHNVIDPWCDDEYIKSWCRA